MKYPGYGTANCRGIETLMKMNQDINHKAIIMSIFQYIVSLA